jgi:hypothetical protein
MMKAAGASDIFRKKPTNLGWSHRAETRAILLNMADSNEACSKRKTMRLKAWQPVWPLETKSKVKQ